jgi:hypothetical protein
MRAFLFAIFLSIASCKTSTPDTLKEEIVIKFMDFHTMTFFPVTCDNLIQHTSLDSVVVRDSSQLNNVSLFLKEFKKTKLVEIDCRGEILIQLESGTSKYCFDTFGNFTDNKNNYSNPRLFDFIKVKTRQ